MGRYPGVTNEHKCVSLLYSNPFLRQLKDRKLSRFFLLFPCQLLNYLSGPVSVENAPARVAGVLAAWHDAPARLDETLAWLGLDLVCLLRGSALHGSDLAQGGDAPAMRADDPPEDGDAPAELDAGCALRDNKVLHGWWLGMTYLLRLLKRVLHGFPMCLHSEKGQG